MSETMSRIGIIEVLWLLTIGLFAAIAASPSVAGALVRAISTQ
jgi:hypothetical protein